MDKREFELEQLKLDNTIKKISDQTYYVWGLLENKKATFKSRTNNTGDEIVYSRAQKDVEDLKHAKKEPFFGRFALMMTVKKRIILANTVFVIEMKM